MEKRPAMMVYIDSGWKIYVHPWQFGSSSIPEWMTRGKATLTQKDIQKKEPSPETLVQNLVYLWHHTV